MRLRRTAGDLRDLENIVDHLFDQTPQHAPRLMRSIYDSEFNTEGTEAMAQRAQAALIHALRALCHLPLCPLC